MTGNARTSAPRPPLNTLPEYAGFTRNLQDVIQHLTGYRVWTSDAGALYATRTRDLTKTEQAAGIARTIGADGPLDLADAITEQLHKATAAAAKAADDES